MMMTTATTKTTSTSFFLYSLSLSLSSLIFFIRALLYLYVLYNYLYIFGVNCLFDAFRRSQTHTHEWIFISLLLIQASIAFVMFVLSLVVWCVAHAITHKCFCFFFDEWHRRVMQKKLWNWSSSSKCVLYECHTHTHIHTHSLRYFVRTHRHLRLLFSFSHFLSLFSNDDYLICKW